jgi:hypothetical protein
MLPDDVLLVIFDLCADEDPYEKKEIEVWQPLVHVCRRWRSVAFGSPNRLNLRLVCTAKTPAMDTLDVWPPLPLLIRDRTSIEEGLENIIAVLERSDRVHVIDLEDVSSSDLEKLSAAMQEPFPELTRLELSSYREVVLPDSFLGGSAPRLQFFHLFGISFPGLPQLLLSATHLVNLYLWSTPHSGYISPEAMSTALSALTSLEELVLEFQSPHFLDQATRRPPPPTRSVLSVLRYFRFKGDSEYLDDLVAHIDTPRLNDLYIIFFSQIVFDTPRFIQFISRTAGLKALEKAHVIFAGGAATVKFSSLTSGDGLLHVGISCRELDWQVSSLEQVCTSCLPPLSTLEHLYIYEDTYWQAHRQDNIENVLWLELLHPFRTVKKLYLSEEFAQRIAPALKELVGARMTEVLPALQNIFLEGLRPSGLVQEGIRQFVAAREVTSHPIAVSPWDRRQDKVPRGLWLANAYDILPH